MEFRLDRIVTLYLTAPARKLRSQPGLPIPVLMYHSISDDRESGKHAYYQTNTPPRIFAEQMEYLHKNGYSSATASEAILRVKSGAKSDKRVVITFDDGLADFYQNAFPIIARYGFQAIMYLPTSYIRDVRTLFKGKHCLTWDEVRELSRYGVQFGSHTVTHPQLRTLTSASVKEEITTSKKTIEDKLGCSVESFAYPYAFPQADRPFRRMLRDSLACAGYQNGVCTIVGRATGKSDRFFMERLPINSADDSALLEAKLMGAYDWVGKVQRFSKFANRQIGKLLGSKPSAAFATASGDSAH